MILNLDLDPEMPSVIAGSTIIVWMGGKVVGSAYCKSVQQGCAVFDLEINEGVKGFIIPTSVSYAESKNTGVVEFYIGSLES